jgi:hypothetical protein
MAWPIGLIVGHTRIERHARTKPGSTLISR